MRLIALLALCFAAVAAVPKNPQRIIGGSTTNISQYPAMAALLFSWTNSGHRQSCGGSILTSRSILTAAHCTIGDHASRWRTRVGSSNANSGGVVHNTQSIINHPNYNSWTVDNDIAILRLSTTISFNNNARVALIAGPNYYPADNQVVWATGWGRTAVNGASSEQLRHVQVWTVNQNTCSQRYAAIGKSITANMLCSGWLDVGGRDQCQGDSGGPLYHNGVVVGVCSWGESCALARFPGVNARVSRYSSWIQSNSGDHANNWRVRVGSTFANSGGVVHNSQTIINHPSYNGNTFNNDVAIIRISTTFSFNNNVKAASIAGSNYNLGNNQVVWAAGWGTISSGGPASEQLRHVQIWTVAQNTCAQRYSEVGMTITNNMLCSGWLDVGGRDQCQGDSGGPLYHNNVLLVLPLGFKAMLKKITG